MNILVDIRPLLGGEQGGVGQYTAQILRALLRRAPENHYILFSNSARKPSSPAWLKSFSNVSLAFFNFPNKFLNAALRLGAIQIDKLALSKNSKLKKIDLVFLPNFNFFSVSKNLPTVITAHDLSFEVSPDFFSAKERLWHATVAPRKQALGAARVIAVSESTADDLANIYRLPPERVKIIYSGIEEIFSSEKRPEDDFVRRRFNLPRRFFLVIGAQTVRKNTLGAVEAFLKLKKQKPQAKDAALVLVGEFGAETAAIARIVKSSDYGADIFNLGPLPRSFLPPLFRLATAFIYPSFYEGFGFPPLEAMASGTSVISSFSGSLPEIVGGAGILINPYNIEEARAAMEEMLFNENLRAKLREDGLKRTANFSWAKAAEETAAAFKEAVARR